MIRDIFNSLNESIKKRNNPEDFISNTSNEKDVIHRGYLKNAEYPIRYNFIPDEKGNANSGIHAYHFKSGKISGVVEIVHKYSPDMSGVETKSHVNYENMGGEKLEPIDLHRMVIPIVKHHVKSHDPDVITFGKGIRYADDVVRRLNSPYLTSKSKDKFTAKKNIDPKMKRVISHIKKKLNKDKEK
jgi:hypothetical protein